MTWHQYYNYGTSLQLYALSTFLRNRGEEPYVINYHTREPGPSGGNVKLIQKAFGKMDHYLYRVLLDEEKSPKQFRNFLDKNLTFTSPCDTLSELEQLNDTMDAFICGSDQIWSPMIFDPHFYLDFVTDDFRKIAYAPSVGLPAITNKFVREEIKKYTGRISYLSTREKSGSKLIEEIVGRPVKTVLDPTFLLTKDDWHSAYIHTEYNDKPYVLTYMLGHNEKQWKVIRSIADALDFDLRIVPVYYNDYHRKGCISDAIGPEEFLNLIDNASYICTDSFHGTIFSILFHKNFTVFERFKNKSEKNQNSRIYNLLQIVNLEERLWKNNRTSDIHQNIDFDKVDALLQEERFSSEQFLLNALDSVRCSKKKEAKNNIQKNLTLCCGCGGCAAVCPVDAINIQMNHEGFYSSSVQNEKCISCGKCRYVCPYISGTKYDNMCVKGALYSFKYNSHDVLMQSSSGGAAYAISLKAFQERNIVAGCRFNIEEQKSEHIIINDSSKLIELQGSKYMQSDFSGIAAQIQNIDNAVIFGTPCQIAAARNLCKGKNILFVDLICHGVPTNFLFQSYKNYLQKKHGINPDKLDITFRYKPEGWRERYIYSTDGENSVCNHQSKDPYFLAFEHGVCYSPTCYECPWRNKSRADIRIGDYWHTRFSNDTTGVSMVLVMSENGNEWVSKLSNNENVSMERTEIADYINCQQMSNLSAPLYREEVIEKLQNNIDLEDIVNDYVMPLENERRMRKQFGKLKGAVKRNG